MTRPLLKYVAEYLMSASGSPRHQVGVWQDGKADDDRDDAPTGERDDRDQHRLFENVTEDLEPSEGSTRPKRSPKPNAKYSPDDYDLNYVGSKSRTRSRRSYRRA